MDEFGAIEPIEVARSRYTAVAMTEAPDNTHSQYSTQMARFAHSPPSGVSPARWARRATPYLRERAQDCADYLRTFLEATGKPPTVLELSVGLSVSESAAWTYLILAAQLGLVRKTGEGERHWWPSDVPHRCQTCGQTVEAVAS